MKEADEYLMRIHTETIKLAQLAKLGLATEKGFITVKDSLQCKGVYQSEPCKNINTHNFCSLKYFCGLRKEHAEWSKIKKSK